MGSVVAFTSAITFGGDGDGDGYDGDGNGNGDDGDGYGGRSRTSSAVGPSNMDILQWAAEAAAPSSTSVRSSLAAADAGLRRVVAGIVHATLELEGVSLEGA